MRKFPGNFFPPFSTISDYAVSSAASTCLGEPIPDSVCASVLLGVALDGIPIIGTALETAGKGLRTLLKYGGRRTASALARVLRRGLTDRGLTVGKKLGAAIERFIDKSLINDAAGFFG